jgi:hypothetical protein
MADDDQAPQQLSVLDNIRQARAQLATVSERVAPLTKDHIAGSGIARRLVDVIAVLDLLAQAIEGILQRQEYSDAVDRAPVIPNTDVL